jgi:hypothetical protein
MRRSLFVFVIGASAVSCVSRAPSEYELDRRAGLMPSLEVEKAKSGALEINQMSFTGKSPTKPVRAAPWFERVWVYDQELDGGYWMQGTYVFLEVEPGRWVKPEEGGQ